jgi:ribosome maturation factor RimP
MASRTLDEPLLKEFAAIAAGAGCELVDARFQSATLRLTLDHPEGVTLDHCQMVSKQVSALLDVTDWGGGRYTLEVTSPGLDRELFRPQDYEKFAGSQVRVTWRPPEGKRTVVGTLERFIPAIDNPDGAPAIVVAVAPDQAHHIPLPSIDAARLVPDFQH